MPDIKRAIKDAGRKAVETATNVSHKIGERAERAADWVKGKAQEMRQRPGELRPTEPAPQATSLIRESMEVFASCGTRIGKVDRVDGNAFELTKDDPQAGGRHHLIPLDWVARVDQHVHLNKESRDVRQGWPGEAVVTG